MLVRRCNIAKVMNYEGNRELDQVTKLLAGSQDEVKELGKVIEAVRSALRKTGQDKELKRIIATLSYTI